MERYTATCEAMQISHIVRYNSTGMAHIIGPRPEEHTVEVTMDFLEKYKPELGDYLVVYLGTGVMGIRSKEDFEQLWVLEKML